MIDENEYAAAWQDLERREKVALVLLLGTVPGIPVLILVGIPSSVAVGTWFFLLTIALSWFFSFRCPRCDNRFFASWWINDPLAVRCLHCELPKGAKQDRSRLHD